MDKELYINGNLMELEPTAPIGFTYQSNNLGELQMRQGVFSNIFKLPKTKNNRLSLEWSDQMSSVTSIPYRQLDVKYVEHGIETVTGGIGVLQNVDEKYFHINVVGGNVGLAKSIGDLLVGDLYTDDDDHIWSLDAVKESIEQTKPYIYSLIDWDSTTTTFFDAPTVDINKLLPTLRVSDIMSRLATRLGYTFEGSYIESDEHLNMIITPDEFSLNEDTVDLETKKGFHEGQPVPFTTIDVGQGESTDNYSIYPEHNTFESTEFTNNNYSPDTTHQGKLQFACDVDVLWFASENYQWWQTKKERDYHFVAQVYDENTATVIAQKTYEIVTTKLGEPTKTFIVDVETDYVLLEAGHNYKTRLYLTIQQHDNIGSKINFKFQQAELRHLPSTSIVLGSTIKIRDLYRMRVQDVLFDALNKRGVVIDTNSYTKTTTFSFFDDLIDNKSIAEDWSDKVDIRQSVLGFRFGNYSQKNWFRFKSEDGVTEELGDYYFLIDDTTLIDEKTVVQLNHPATEQSNKYLGENIPSIDGLDSLSEWIQPQYRILQLDRRNVDYTLTFTDGGSNEVIASAIPFCGFQGFKDLIPTNYEALREILSEAKTLSLIIKLTPVDIHNLQYMIPKRIQIDELGVDGYFYLNKVGNYINGVSQCDFVKI